MDKRRPVELPGTIPLFTRLGREISNAQDRDPHPIQVERFQGAFHKQFPWVTERRPPCGQYNCHGLTFANRRTGVYEPKEIRVILDDDGYRPIKLSDVEAGDLVVYLAGSEITHTAIALELVEGVPAGSRLRAVKVLSKWGSAGEYVHMANEGPYREDTMTYWTDRP